MSTLLVFLRVQLISGSFSLINILLLLIPFYFVNAQFFLEVERFSQLFCSVYLLFGTLHQGFKHSFISDLCAIFLLLAIILFSRQYLMLVRIWGFQLQMPSALFMSVFEWYLFRLKAFFSHIFCVILNKTRKIFYLLVMLIYIHSYPIFSGFWVCL